MKRCPLDRLCVPGGFGWIGGGQVGIDQHYQCWNSQDECSLCCCQARQHSWVNKCQMDTSRVLETWWWVMGWSGIVQLSSKWTLARSMLMGQLELDVHSQAVSWVDTGPSPYKWSGYEWNGIGGVILCMCKSAWWGCWKSSRCVYLWEDATRHHQPHL